MRQLPRRARADRAPNHGSHPSDSACFLEKGGPLCDSDYLVRQPRPGHLYVRLSAGSLRKRHRLHAARPEIGKKGKKLRPEGFEPPTYWFVARHSIQLSYGRVATRIATGASLSILNRKAPSSGGRLKLSRAASAVKRCCNAPVRPYARRAHRTAEPTMKAIHDSAWDDHLRVRA